MNRFSKVLIAFALCLFTLQAYAKEVPTEIKSIIEKQLLSQLEIKAVDLDKAAEQVFRESIYHVKPLLGYSALVDGKVLDLNKPNSPTKLPGYLTLIRDDFLLDSRGKADTLEKAFETIFPYKLEKQVRPVKIDHGWIIFRDDFFDNYIGLVFTTDEKGKITKVEYVLSIDPKTYAYEAPTSTR